VDSPIVLVIIFGGVFGGMAIIVLPTLWFHYRDEAQKREKAHAERMRSLEAGFPLPDAQIARYTALGWIGVGVPVAALAAALTATLLLGLYRESSDVALAIPAIWLCCLGICVVALRAAILRLRDGGEQLPVVVPRGADRLPEVPDPSNAVFENRDIAGRIGS
jgi:hypothetical protein